MGAAALLSIIAAAFPFSRHAAAARHRGDEEPAARIVDYPG